VLSLSLPVVEGMRRSAFFVRAAAEAGQHITQREKVDPRAVLGVVVQRQAARAVQAAE
jgi:hypothetical protein